MSRYAPKHGKRKDANHNQIVSALIEAGFAVTDFNTSGKGATDLFVCEITNGEQAFIKGGFVEIKSEEDAQIKPDQLRFYADCRFHICLVRTPDEAIAFVKSPLEFGLSREQKQNIRDYLDVQKALRRKVKSVTWNQFQRILRGEF